MSKATRHECPIAADRATLHQESQIEEEANEIRRWYEAWGLVWDIAHARGLVGPSGSPMWADTTREVRKCLNMANTAGLLRWLEVYVGATSPKPAAVEQAEAEPIDF